MQGVLRWETPPPASRDTYRTRNRRSWAVVASQLRANPGQWGVIEEGGSDVKALGMRIIRGDAFWAPRGAFRIVTRTLDDIPTLFAVYVGESGEYADQADDALKAMEAAHTTEPTTGSAAGPGTGPDQP